MGALNHSVSHCCGEEADDDIFLKHNAVLFHVWEFMYTTRAPDLDTGTRTARARARFFTEVHKRATETDSRHPLSSQPRSAKRNEQH